jgi:hypothetical protein
MATRLEQLQQISQNLPVANQRVVAQQQAARNIQMQQQLGQMGTTAGVPQAQQVGAAQTAAAGQQNLSAQNQLQQQTSQVAKIGLQQQQQQNQQALASKQLNLEDQSRKLDAQVSQLNEQQKAQLFDNRMKFNYTKEGEAYMNTRQLSDWTRLNAQNQQQYQDYSQKMDQLSKAQIYTLQVASSRIDQQMREQSQLQIQQAGYATKEQLTQAKAAIDAEIKKKQANAANNRAQWTAGGQIVGAVVGGVAAGIFSGGAAAPAGAAAGAAVGGGIGTMVGSQQNQQQEQ